MCIRTTGNGIERIPKALLFSQLMPLPLSINSVHNLSIILKTFLIKWEFFSSFHTRFFLFIRSPSLLTQQTKGKDICSEKENEFRTQWNYSKDIAYPYTVYRLLEIGDVRYVVMWCEGRIIARWCSHFRFARIWMR